MKRLIQFIALMLLLVLPVTVNAISWSKQQLNPGDSSYADIISSDTTANPPRLFTGNCGSDSSLRLIANTSDETGIAANGINIEIYACAQAAGTTAAGCRQLYDRLLGTGIMDGVPATGTASFYGLLGTYLFVDVTVAVTTAVARVEVHCQ